MNETTELLIETRTHDLPHTNDYPTGRGSMYRTLTFSKHKTLNYDPFKPQGLLRVLSQPYSINDSYYPT